MIVIVDYGVGNLSSLKNMFRKLGVEVASSSDSEIISKATKLILPGVGAFDTCAQKLKETGLVPLLNQRVLNERIPVLGVCVGMQLLASGSEEGVLPGLSWIPGKVVKFRTEKMPFSYKVPHMGWTDVKPIPDSPLFYGLNEEPRFYFVHSYHVIPDNPAHILATAEYGYTFTAGVESANIRGVQFHPEKSHRFGLQLLANFNKFC